MNRSPYKTVNGWRLYQHSSFRIPFEKLLAEVEELCKNHPDTFHTHPKTKILLRIRKIIEEEIPRDPAHLCFALGNTLGKARRHWRRAKFLKRFRLFSRFDSASKVIILCWLNDENTLRKEGAKTDPYAVFLKNLLSGNPPDDWDKLMAEVE